MAPPADAILAFASAFPLVLLGIGLLLIRPHRPPQVFFGLFAIVWGAQIALANFGRMYGDPDLHRTLLLASHACLPVATLFIAHFAVVLRRRRRARAVSALFALLAGASAVVLILDPSRIVESVAVQDGMITTAYGGLAFPFFQGPFRLALYIALLFSYLEYRRAKPGSKRRGVRGILLALALYVSYDTPRTLISFLLKDDGLAQFSSSASQTAGGLADLGATIFLLAGTALLVFLAGHAFLRPPPPEEPDAPLLVAFLFPAIVAGSEELLALTGLQLETLGFWRFLMVGVVVFTLANYQLFGLELRLKRFAAPVVVGVLALFGVPILLTLALGEFGTVPFLFALVPQVVGVAGIVVFQDRVRSALFPGVHATPDYMHERRLEIYRVALEDVLARGGSGDDPKLKELRLRSKISEQEHSLLVWVANSGQARAPAAASMRFEPGATILDRYLIIRTIGHGTYGGTFLAQELRTKREVAIKTVSVSRNEGTAAQLLLREARLAASIDHPNVIDILDVAELQDRVIVVMEYADNGNLEDYMKRTGALAFPDAVRFLRELLAALEAVHVRGIIHRNLKPKNILIEADDSVRLSDFGAATSGHQDSAQTEFASRTLVDLLYQSPEQLAGEPATVQSDLFVAAVLFHQGATGRYPFPIAGKADHQIRETIRNAVPELHLRGLPEWVAPFLEKALAREPSGRFRDASEMRRGLEQAAGL